MFLTVLSRTRAKILVVHKGNILVLCRPRNCESVPLGEAPVGVQRGLVCEAKLAFIE